ncbi:MAG: porin family protein [Proteobacteria bacterium]|nr:porin family protein [Pseudomonadota bacterium]
MRASCTRALLCGVLAAAILLFTQPFGARADTPPRKEVGTLEKIKHEVAQALRHKVSAEFQFGPSYVDFYGSAVDNDEVIARFRFCAAVDAIGSVAGMLGVSVGFHVHRHVAVQVGWARTCRGSALEDPPPEMEGGRQELSYNEYSLAVRYERYYRDTWRWYPLAGLALADLRSAYSFNEVPSLPPVDITDWTTGTDFLPFVGFGAAYRIRGRVYATAELRGYLGFRTIDDNAANGIDDVKNRGLTFLIGLRWANEPQPPRHRRAVDDKGDSPVDDRDTSPGTDNAHDCSDDQCTPDAQQQGE